MDTGAGLAAGVGFGPQPTDVLAFFKMKIIAFAIPQHLYIHVFRRILRGAGTKAIESQRIFVVAIAGAIVFAAGIQFAKDQFPVVALLLGVIIHRAAAAEILHFDAAIGIAGGDDLFAISLPGLINGIGEDFEHRMLTALQTIGAKNNAGAFANPIGAL